MAHVPREPEPSRRVATLGLLNPPYRNYVLAMVALGNGFSYLDRQIVTILLPAIKADLQVSDAQLGIMSGLAFALFYAIMGVPLARLADRWSRRNLMVLSVTAWSAMTAVGGFVQTFPQLVLARFGVGIGEAGFTPAGFSMISDYFTKARRQTASAIISIGSQAGVVSGLLIGGLLTPIIGWRGAFLVAGTPGLLYALVFLFTVKEPLRGMADGLAASRPTPPPFFASVARLWKIRSYRYVVLMGAMFSFTNFGESVWMPSFLARSHGMSLSSIGITLAAATTFGAIGTVVGGLIGDRLYRREERLSLLIPIVGGLATIPLMVASLMAGSSNLALLLYAAAKMLTTVHTGTMFALVQTTAPLPTRALGVAFLGLTVNMIGLGLGPLTVGFVSDHLTPMLGKDSLRGAMILMTFTAVIPVAFAALAMRTLNRDIAESNPA